MNELQVVERSPKNEVAFGQKAAESLMHIVREKKLARKFGGEKEHLFVEAWEILGQFAGLSAVVRSAGPVEIDGIKGAESFVELVNEQGQVIGGAIALCLRDEPNWRNKPFFQLISMAQTRAVSKAFRIKLGWVASMAGYSGTPAEEMEGVYPAPTHTKTKAPGRSPRGEALSKPSAESMAPPASDSLSQLVVRRNKALAACESIGYAQEDMEGFIGKGVAEWDEADLLKLGDWYKKELAQIKAHEEQEGQSA